MGSMTPTDEPRELRNLNIYGWYVKGALACLRVLDHYGMIKATANPLEVGKKYSDAKETAFIDATIIKQCFSDRSFLDCFLKQDELDLRWSKENRNGKEYKSLVVIPCSKAQN